MKTLKCSFAAKAAAVILLCMMVLSCVASFTAVAFTAFNSYDSAGSVSEEIVCSKGWEMLHNLGTCFLNGYYYGGYDEPNFYYSYYNNGDETAQGSGSMEPSYSNYSGQPLQWAGAYYDAGHDSIRQIVTADIYIKSRDAGADCEELINSFLAEHPNSNIVIGGIAETLQPGSSLYTLVNLMGFIAPRQGLFTAICIASFIIGILLFCFLMSAAGHHRGAETVTASWFDKLPLELVIVVLGVVVIFGGAAFIELIYSSSTTTLMNEAAWRVPFGLLALTGAGLSLLLFLMSCSVRVKLGCLFKSSLCYRFFYFCLRQLRRLAGLIRELLKGLPLLWKYIVGVAALLLVEFFFIIASFDFDRGTALGLWFLERLLLVPLFLLAVLGFKRLREATAAIAAGATRSVSTRYLKGGLLHMAEDLNNIELGLKAAVDERMKAEHFRTELITNVSHDIKTPLTSIINYTDLLAKEEPENEKMREYIEVISRQSDKLKKLIGDLIEASKASSGTLNVELSRTELGVLIEQAEGEYSDKLRAAGLELICKKPEKPVYFMADGRHMWRIFDNLLNNILKYSQQGTRVYLSGAEQDGKAVFVFRNISNEELNIPADKLMERFVRGDASRHSSGSGLGLSIAKSLAELQGGSLRLDIDGDLFKVTLSFGTCA